MKNLLIFLTLTLLFCGCTDNESISNLELDKPYITSQVNTSSISIYIGGQENIEPSVRKKIINYHLNEGHFFNEDSLFIPSSRDTILFIRFEALINSYESYEYSIDNNLIRLFKQDTVGSAYPSIQTLFGKHKLSYMELIELPDFTNGSRIVEKKIEENYFKLEPQLIKSPLLAFRLYSRNLSMNIWGSINNEFNEEFIKELSDGDTLIVQELWTTYQ